MSVCTPPVGYTAGISYVREYVNIFLCTVLVFALSMPSAYASVCAVSVLLVVVRVFSD